MIDSGPQKMFLDFSKNCIWKYKMHTYIVYTRFTKSQISTEFFQILWKNKRLQFLTLSLFINIFQKLDTVLTIIKKN